MEASDVMQMAADHAAKAEQFMVQDSPSQARIHTEQSKLLVAMAREVRIGNHRSRTYQGLVFKPVVLAEALSVGSGDGVREFEDGDGDVASGVVDDLTGSARQDEALRLSEVDSPWSWGSIAAHLGYASPESAREAARSARLRRDAAAQDVPTGSELGGTEPQ